MSKRKTGARGPSLHPRLRPDAEKRVALSRGTAAEMKKRPVEDLVHELQVHQIELEMQNEELRKAQIALEESRDKYVELYEFAPVGYFTLTQAAVILEVNLSGAALLGAQRPSLVQRSFRRHVAPGDLDRWDRYLTGVHPEGASRSCEVVLRREDGVTFPARLDSVPVRGNGGTAVVRMAVSDISERKRAEQERLEMERRLLHAQKLESLGVMAGGIAHDFNNLLTAITGNLALALAHLSPASAARERMEEAVRATKRAAELTRQLLAYSGRGRFVLEALDLSAAVDENAHMLRAAIPGTVTLSLHLGKPLPAIAADAAQIQQIVMNLITNAAEAIGDRTGVVTLSTGVGAFDASYLGRGRVAEDPAPGRFVWLEVTDTGSGMDSVTQQRLFDPFFTTKFTGRGLGMSAVLGIVKGHGGTLIVDSQPGKGTTIRVLLPPSETPSAAKGSNVHAPGGSPHEEKPSAVLGTILVVDDEDVVRDVCAQMVEFLGFQVLRAANGEEAVSLFRAHSREIVGVILDLTMPQMDGVAAFEALRQIQPNVNVILSSGYDEQEATERFAGRGLACFLQKPYELDTLKERLERVRAL